VDGMAARGGPDGKRAAARCSADIELSSARSSCGGGAACGCSRLLVFGPRHGMADAPRAVRVAMLLVARAHMS
jgi:hypothetical protein